MDLSKIEGLSLTDEQKAAIEAQNNFDIEGLKNKNNALLDEKKTAQQLVQEANENGELQKAALLKAEEEKLKLAGDLDGLKEFYTKQNSENEAKYKGANEQVAAALLSRDTETVLQQILAKTHPDQRELAEPLLRSQMNVTHNDKGEVVTEFKVGGETVATDVDTFIAWGGENSKAWQQVLLAVDSSGADGKKTNGQQSQEIKPLRNMSMSEKKAYMSKKHNKV